jgi:antitoxin component of MazEF toxin-antitoxin module
MRLGDTMTEMICQNEYRKAHREGSSVCLTVPKQFVETMKLNTKEYLKLTLWGDNKIVIQRMNDGVEFDNR